MRLQTIVKNKFFNKLLVFVSGDIINKAIPFLLLPILTHYLTPSDYGIIASFMAIIPLFGIILGFGTQSSVFSNYFRMDKNDLKSYIGTVFYIIIFSFLFLLILLYLFNEYLLIYVKIDYYWFFLALFLALSQLITTMNLRLWIAEENAKYYSFYQISQTITSLCIILTLVIGFNYHWQGYLIGYSFATLLFALLSIILIYKREYLKLGFNLPYLKDALKFGFPLIIHASANWMKNNSDRLILISLIGSSPTGIYFVGFQISMVIVIISNAFNKAWSSYLFRELASFPNERTKKKIVQYVYLFFIGILMFSFVYSEIMKIILPYLLDDKFLEVKNYLLFLSIAFAFQGMYIIITSFIYFEKKTSKLSILTLVSSLFYVIMLFILVEYYGIDGAVDSILCVSIVVFLFSWKLSNDIYPMPWFFFLTKRRENE